mgnify:CR=1 FL=1
MVQGLLRRETLDWDYAGQRRAIRFLNPELELINLADAIPFYISAFGPRGKALAARLGTGWIYGVRNAAQSVAQLQLMQQAWREAGRDPGRCMPSRKAVAACWPMARPYDSPRAPKRRFAPVRSWSCTTWQKPTERRTLGYRFPDDLQPLFEAFQRNLCAVHAQPCQISPGAPRWHPHAPAARRGASRHHRTDQAAHAHGDKTAPARRDSCLTRRRLCGNLRPISGTGTRRWWRNGPRCLPECSHSGCDGVALVCAIACCLSPLSANRRR